MHLNKISLSQLILSNFRNYQTWPFSRNYLQHTTLGNNQMGVKLSLFIGQTIIAIICFYINEWNLFNGLALPKNLINS